MIFQLKGATTINLASTMTAAQIQAKINSVPKNLNGFDLTFQFADGSYSLTSHLEFNNFQNGRVYIKGNPSENQWSKHSNQAVQLTLTAAGGVIRIYRCTEVHASNLKITNTLGTGFGFWESGGRVNGCCLVGADNVETGIWFQDGSYGAQYNYITYFQQGIAITNGMAYSYDNAELTNSPRYGLVARTGGTLSKAGGTQPAGATANEKLETGGLIRATTLQAITASDPPTQAEMVAALGAASDYPNAVLLCSSTGGTPYHILSNGTNWYYNTFTVGA